MEKRGSSYQNLILWQKSFELAKRVYLLTKQFPRSELYGITNQIRRAAVSIVSNIAEGFSRNTAKEKLQFSFIAFGSSAELETQLLLAQELGFAPPAVFNEIFGLLSEVRKMLNHYLLKPRS